MDNGIGIFFLYLSSKKYFKQGLVFVYLSYVVTLAETRAPGLKICPAYSLQTEV